jgi:GTPase Era involved in 16S rRNA processing
MSSLQQFHSIISAQEEIPYSCEVIISNFKDKTPELSVIDADIVVSRIKH